MALTIVLGPTVANPTVIDSTVFFPTGIVQPRRARLGWTRAREAMPLQAAGVTPRTAGRATTRTAKWRGVSDDGGWKWAGGGDSADLTAEGLDGADGGGRNGSDAEASEHPSDSSDEWSWYTPCRTLLILFLRKESGHTLVPYEVWWLPARGCSDFVSVRVAGGRACGTRSHLKFVTVRPLTRSTKGNGP